MNVNVNVNVNNFLAISESDFDNSGEPGSQAEGVNHLETSLTQLYITHRASSCAKRGGHLQLHSKPRGARGIESETFRGRGTAFITSSAYWTMCMVLARVAAAFTEEWKGKATAGNDVTAAALHLQGRLQHVVAVLTVAQQQKGAHGCVGGPSDDGYVLHGESNTSQASPRMTTTAV